MFVSLKSICISEFNITFHFTGWFGLRRNLCEIILDRCSCISIYCNNQFKSESHLSRNDSLLDITTSTASQNIQSMSIQKLSIIKNKNENILTKQFNNTSLLEPD